MATEIKIPIPDQTTEQVRIVKWHKRPGEAVKSGEVVLEVETDKSVIEVEATGAGVILECKVKVDDMVPVGEVVGLIGSDGEQTAPAAGAAKKSAASAAGTGAAGAGGVKVSPAAKKVAEKLGVNLSGLTGTGTGGKIMREDVEKVAEKKGAGETAGLLAPKGTGSSSASGSGEIVEVKVPIPDQTTERVRIVRWHKGQGDAVKAGEVVLEIETDKSVMEVEATGSGVLLKQLRVQDEEVPVGEVIGYIGAPGAAIPTTGGAATAAKGDTVGKAQTAAEAVSKAPPAADRPAGRLFASPNARRLAREWGVDILQVRGSGPNGRIIGRDVEKAKAAGMGAAAAARATTPAAGTGGPAAGTTVPVTKMRRAIGVNLQRSARDTPHFNVTMAIDMSRAMKVRAEVNTGKDKSQKVTVNDLVVRACALVLKQMPAVNCRFEEDRISYLAEVNVGVATAVPEGLIVPVVTHADERSWEQLAAETKRVVAEARNGKIIGLGKGTFTVSNLGMFGIESFTAIINPPESAILAVGGLKDEVVVIDGNIGIRPIMRVTLCSDHRLIDGALAAEFLQRVKSYLEEGITAF